MTQEDDLYPVLDLGGGSNSNSSSSSSSNGGGGGGSGGGGGYGSGSSVHRQFVQQAGYRQHQHQRHLRPGRNNNPTATRTPNPTPPTHPHHPAGHKHAVLVDTIITDSNGNTSRYDSDDHIAANAALGSGAGSGSGSGSSGGAARVNASKNGPGRSGKSLGTAHSARKPNSPRLARNPNSPQGARSLSSRHSGSDLYFQSVSGERSGGGGGGGGGGGQASSNASPSNRKSGMTAGGGSRRSSPGKSASGAGPPSGGSASPSAGASARSAAAGSGGSSSNATASNQNQNQNQNHNSNHNSARADGRLSSTSSDHSSNSLMSQEAVFLHVPTVALTPDPVGATTTTTTAHHSRASSFRAPKATPRSELTVEDGVMAHVRRNSMPNVTNNLLNVPGAPSSSGSNSSGGGGGGDASASSGLGVDPGGKDTRIRRVRSFKTTSKGAIVNRGDSFKKKSTHSLMSTGSTVTDAEARARCNSGNNNNGLLDYGNSGSGSGSGPAAPAYFRVNMMGAAGVGKTSMAHQFLTSEYVDHDDTDETHHMTVTVLLDGEESTIEFIDPPDRNVISEGLEQLLDAYVVVFAINDHDSFDTAHQLVRYLRVDYGTDRAILLVANKIDLVRKRKVTTEEARLVATTFDCKYVETSAALNHYVDELLVGIISQIRLQLSIPFSTIFFPHKDAKRRKNKKALCKGPKGFFSRLFRRGGFGSHGGKKDRGVDNLLY